MSEPLTIQLTKKEMKKAFSNFPKYIESLENDFQAHKVGIVKLIFPSDFQPVKEGFSLETVKTWDLNITEPIIQAFETLDEEGVYHSIFQPTSAQFNVSEFWKMTELQKYKTPNVSHEELEQAYWKPSSFEPIYGTNTSHQLMNSPIFNFGILNTILDLIPSTHEGIHVFLLMIKVSISSYIALS